MPLFSGQSHSNAHECMLGTFQYSQINLFSLPCAFQFPVLFERPLGLVGRAYDRLGRHFHNFSSLDLKWGSDNVNVVHYFGHANHTEGKSGKAVHVFFYIEI